MDREHYQLFSHATRLAALVLMFVAPCEPLQPPKSYNYSEAHWLNYCACWLYICHQGHAPVSVIGCALASRVSTTLQALML